MDEYYLSRDDWDTIVELGVDGNKSDLILKKISPATKTTLTKKCLYILFCAYLPTYRVYIRYNACEHPIAFHRQDLGKAPKKISGGAVPDLEEAFDVSCVLGW
jgi:replication factor C subunit 1